MNAVNAGLRDELAEAARAVHADPGVRAVILYGGERVFAAGADIKEMETMSYTDMVDHSALLLLVEQLSGRTPSTTSKEN